MHAACAKPLFAHTPGCDCQPAPAPLRRRATFPALMLAHCVAVFVRHCESLLLTCNVGMGCGRAAVEQDALVRGCGSRRWRGVATAVKWRHAHCCASILRSAADPVVSWCPFFRICAADARRQPCRWRSECRVPCGST